MQTNTAMKMWYLTAWTALMVCLAGCVSVGGGWSTVNGSGHVISETRTVTGFDRVSIAGTGELTVVQGDQESLTIEAEDNLLPFLRAEVTNGRLAIGPHNVNVHPTRTIRYQLQVKTLRDIDLSGAIRAEASQIKTDRLGLGISGAGKVTIAHLEAGTLTTRISGSGTMIVAGRVDKQEINISGSGNHQARELKSAKADVNISGSGRASLWVTEFIKAHISGSGNVDYHGSPSVDSHVSGSGRIRYRE